MGRCGFAPTAEPEKLVCNASCPTPSALVDFQNISAQAAPMFLTPLYALFQSYRQ